jgi:hypothetical protein
MKHLEGGVVPNGTLGFNQGNVFDHRNDETDIQVFDSISLVTSGGNRG